jgi:DNA-binding transcriptional LysR family regulator
MIDWGDLRYVLAVVRAGAALPAARALGVNQTTVMRRITQLEETIGADLFERKPSGYAPTPLGLRLAQAAEHIEHEVAKLERDMQAEQRVLAGVVRVTTSEVLANRMITPCLQAFYERHAAVRIELIADDRRLEIASGEADVALRAGSRPEGAGIVARRLPDAGWTVYSGKTYAVEHGLPKSPEEIDGHRIVGMDGRMAELPGPIWLRKWAPNAVIRFRSNTLTNLVSNLRAGLGLGTLPCFVGDAEPDLVRCMPPVPELVSEMWLIVREDMKSTPHVRAFADFLAAHVFSIRAQIEG